MLYIKLFIEREKNIGQSAPECRFNRWQSGCKCLASLSPSKMLERRPVETQKNSSYDNLRMSGLVVASEQESCRDSMLSSL